MVSPIAPYCRESVSDCYIYQAYSGRDLVIESLCHCPQKLHSGCSCQSIQKPVVILWNLLGPFVHFFGRFENLLWSKHYEVLKNSTVFPPEELAVLLLGNNVKHWRLDQPTNNQFFNHSKVDIGQECKT